MTEGTHTCKLEDVACIDTLIPFCESIRGEFGRWRLAAKRNVNGMDCEQE